MKLEGKVDGEESEALDDSSYFLFFLLIFKVELISSLLLLGSIFPSFSSSDSGAKTMVGICTLQLK